MTSTFHCPSCGAPLEPDGSSTTVRCPYCSAVVVIPEALREPDEPVRPSSQPESGKNTAATSGRGAKILVGLIAVIVVVSVLIPLVLSVIVPAVAITSAARQFSVVETGQVDFRTPFGSPRTTPSSTPRPSPTPGFVSLELSFGGEGIGPGQFQDARNVAAGRDGRIYVAEYTGGRVQVFDRQGKFLAQFLVDAELPVQGLEIDREGVVYISQGGRITRYDAQSGQVLGEINAPAGQFYRHFTFSPSGQMAVSAISAQSPDDILILDRDGKVVRKIEGAFQSQTGSPELEMSLAFDGLGNLYALGSFTQAVFKFSPEGKFITRFGSRGEEPGQFRSVQGITTDNQGRVYVSDISDIQVFDGTGRYLGKIDRLKTVYFGMMVDPDGNLLVAGRSMIYRFRPPPGK